MDRRRVVVTGMGCVTPLGASIATLWDNLLKGESGVDYTTVFPASLFRTKIAAEVKDWSVADSGENAHDWRFRSRHTTFAFGAAKQAIADSGIEDTRFERTRLGVYTGSGEGQQDFQCFMEMMTKALHGGNFNLEQYLRESFERLHPTRELEQEPNMPAACLAAQFDAQGPNSNCLTACAASSQAVGEATELIRSGHADIMLSGGTHSMIHAFGITGFNLLTALSESNDEPKKASRPFDLNRNGFVIGEGASMLILEEFGRAKKRGAKIYGEMLGYGASSDAFRLTDTHPEARGAIQCLRRTFADAQVAPTDVHYINAHGTSTENNDKSETIAIKALFGDHAYKVPISSTKSMLGHMIAAAGSTELIVCLLAIRDGVLPPTINLDTPDPNCDLDYIPHVARQSRCDVALSNSFGFGGQNVSLIVGRCK